MNKVAAGSAVDFRAIFRALARHIEEAYSLKVNIGPVIVPTPANLMERNLG